MSPSPQPPPPNSAPTYLLMRNAGLAGGAFSVKGLKEKPRRALINYYDDVLFAQLSPRWSSRN